MVPLLETLQQHLFHLMEWSLSYSKTLETSLMEFILLARFGSGVLLRMGHALAVESWTGKNGHLKELLGQNCCRC